MFYARSDKQFEDAGRDGEKFDALLRLCKKRRKWAAINILGVLLLLAALVGWGSFKLFQGLQLIDSTKLSLTNADGPLQSWTNDAKQLTYIVAALGWTLTIALVNAERALSDADARVKMLLLFEGYRSLDETQKPQEKP